MKIEKFKTKLKNFAFALCGWLYLWVVVVNVIGDLLLSGFHSEGSCVPYMGMFGGFGVENCPNKVLEQILYWLVVIPRAHTIYLVMYIYGLYSDWDKVTFDSLFMETPVALLARALPIIVLAIIGTLYWHKKNRFFAVALTCAFCASIAYTVYLY